MPGLNELIIMICIVFSLQAQLRVSGGNQGSSSDDLEKMELLQALEKANGRIAALEKQVCISMFWLVQ